VNTETRKRGTGAAEARYQDIGALENFLPQIRTKRNFKRNKGRLK